MMDKRQLLQENLKILRECLNLSQSEFGKKLGLTRQSITNYETGGHKMPGYIYMAVVGLLYMLDEEGLLSDAQIDIIKKCFKFKLIEEKSISIVQ